MSEIIAVDRLQREAREAAERYHESKLQQRNPYAIGSAAYAKFHRLYCLALQGVKVKEAEVQA